MTKRRPHWLIASLVGGLTIALFVFDVHTPLGVANHVLYIGPVLLAFLSPHRAFPFVVAALCSVLVVVTTFMNANPYDIPLWIPISNRFFSMFVIWIPVLYLYQQRTHEETLRRMNDELETRVRTRTQELLAVNDALVAEVSERMRTEHTLAASRKDLRTLAARLLQIQEQERRRISRDLHDDINQRLAVLIVEMDRLVQQEPPSQGSIGMAVRTLQDRLVELSEDVRKLAYQFHPSILDDLGLSIAIQRLAEDFEARTTIPCRVTDTRDSAPLPQDVATCLYRVAQESLSNIARHAKASRVEIELAQSKQGETLTITDDGVGFDPAHAGHGHEGLGLISMKERVALTDGALEIISQPGKGTEVRVVVPVPSEAP